MEKLGISKTMEKLGISRRRRSSSGSSIFSCKGKSSLMVLEKMKQIKLNPKPIPKSEEENKEADDEWTSVQWGGLTIINGNSKLADDLLAEECKGLNLSALHEIYFEATKGESSSKRKGRRHKPSPSCSKAVKEPISVTFSKAALNYYNEKHGTDYVFDEVVVMNFEVLDSDWVHINFLAKPQNPCGASSKLFFAEVEADHPPKITACSIVKDPEAADDSAPKTVDGCGFCFAEQNLLHPVGGFSVGNWPYLTHGPLDLDEGETIMKMLLGDKFKSNLR